jgi:predicted dehydrogenase
VVRMSLRGIVAGAGALGPFWATELLVGPETELAGWADLDVKAAREAAAELDASDIVIGASVEQMLDELRPDFLVNVTAPGAHHAVTMAALERGVPVLSEKPMAASMEQAREMVAAADRAGVPFMVSQNRRYKPSLEAFRDTVAQLGPLSSLTCDFYRAHRHAAAAFLFTFPQPLLLDMAIHLFDAARAISGADPETVYCESFDPPGTWYEGPAAAHAVFRMSGDVRFAFNGNWAAWGFQTSWTGQWRVVGELGTATWDGDSVSHVEAGNGKVLKPVPLPRPEVEREGRFGQLEDSLNDFLRALRGEGTPQGECHDNILSLAMCHAAVESAAAGAPVPVRG